MTTVRSWVDRYYIGREEALQAVRSWITSVRDDGVNFDDAFLVRPSRLDGSQARMNDLVQEVAEGLSPREAPSGWQGTALYVDDGAYSGRTLASALRRLVHDRGSRAHVIAFHLLQHREDWNNWRAGMARRGVTFMAYREVENRVEFADRLEVIRPMAAAECHVATRYIAMRGQISRARAFQEPTLLDEGRLYASAAERLLVERALLRVGSGIAMVPGANAHLRPLGYVDGRSRSLGFGAVAFSYLNAPNTLPLAFWRELRDATSIDRRWFPLVPRRARH